MAILNHVGIIPDGNRRWALKNTLEYREAYNMSMKHIDEMIRCTYDKGIRSLSIYMLSKENLSRRREDLNAVLEAETYFLRELLPIVADEYNAKVIHAGCTSILPIYMNSEIQDISKRTLENKKHNLYLLIGYSPIDEIRSAKEAKNTGQFELEDLWVGEKVDIVIRTAGGPALLSNFLPLQCGYAQIYIIDEYFNDFEKADYESILNRAGQVPMPYGK